MKKNKKQIIICEICNTHDADSECSRCGQLVCAYCINADFECDTCRKNYENSRGDFWF